MFILISAYFINPFDFGGLRTSLLFIYIYLHNIKIHFIEYEC